MRSVYTFQISYDHHLHHTCVCVDNGGSAICRTTAENTTEERMDYSTPQTEGECQLHGFGIHCKSKIFTTCAGLVPCDESI